MAKGKKRPAELPEYGTVMMKGVQYYRTRITDADGKRVAIYGLTREELYDRVEDAQKKIAEVVFHRENPTVEEYCEKWLLMRSGTVRTNTLEGYERMVNRYIVGSIGQMYMDEVTTDDLRLLMVPLSKGSSGMYGQLNMLIKNIFNSAEESKVIKENPSKTICARGGKPAKRREALTDEQTAILLDSIRELPPYVFVMIGLYAGLRREEILALRWDCVFLDEATPYISVRRAWRSVNNRPVISTELKTPAAKRDIPIPGKLVECLKEAKEKSKSEYVISDRNGNALAESQFVRVWKYIAVRSTEERCYYTYVNGQKIKHVVKPKLGEHQPNNPKLVYTMDFQVTPHQLRHTYITNLIYASVDPKTVQYLAGHENSKVTMDIYAKVKYNKPAQLHGVINRAIDTSKKD
jgi:integrase